MNLLDNITPKPDQTLDFFNVWFKYVDPDSLISIVRIHPSGSQRHAMVLPLGDVKAATETSGLGSLIWEDELNYDLYYSVSTLKRVPESGKRGGLKDVKEVLGVWIDLDVKPGAFESEEDALDVLRNAPITPTAVVLTGRGGVHGYWRLRHPVDCDTGHKLALRWWALLSDMAAPTPIDKLCDPSRVLRLPGALRWPKNKDPHPPTVSVTRLLFSKDVSYTKQAILDLTEEVWSKHEARIKSTRDRVSDNRQRAHNLVTERQSSSTNMWTRYRQVADLEDNFNETYTWASILEPMGWTMLGTDEDERVLWSRPGDGIRKSATTDWPDSPHIMSLFSTAPETGLADLHDSGIILTKYRVWVQLFCGGDEALAITTLLGST